MEKYGHCFLDEPQPPSDAALTGEKLSVSYGIRGLPDRKIIFNYDGKKITCVGSNGLVGKGNSYIEEIYCMADNLGDASCALLAKARAEAEKEWKQLHDINENRIAIYQARLEAATARITRLRESLDKLSQLDPKGRVSCFQSDPAYCCPFIARAALAADDEGNLPGKDGHLEELKALGKECYNEAYFFETEYPSTPWSKLLFRVAKAIEGDNRTS